MKNHKKFGILVAMLFAAVCFGTSEARADHRHNQATFGLSLPNLGIYVGNGGVSVRSGGFYTQSYCGRLPTQYVPPVTTFPRPCDDFDYGQYRRQQEDYRRQQEELRRAQERYQRDLERIQRQYGYRR